MEIERNVKVQIVEGEKDPKGNLLAGFSSGPHASGRLPAFSEAERREGLGQGAIDRIRSVFAPARDKDVESTGDAKTQWRGGW